MRQRHSYHSLLFHLVLHTKNREMIFFSQDDESELAGYLKTKAHDLDCYVEEMGTWNEHCHLLLRTGTTIALCQIYRQLKGFSARAWNLRHPERKLYWGDGVFIVTVDPNHSDALRWYIRNQRRHHARQELNPVWETQ